MKLERSHLVGIQLKYRRSKDTSLPITRQVRKRPYVLFRFRDPATGRRYTKTKIIPHIDLHEDFERGLQVAQEYIHNLRRKLALDVLNLQEIFPTPSTLTLQQFFHTYLELRGKAVQQGRLSAGTLRADVDSSRRFLSVMGADRRLAAITPQHLRRYVDELLSRRHSATDGRPAGKSYSRATVNIDIRTMRAAFAFALRQGLIATNPFSGISELRTEKTPRHLSNEEVLRLRQFFQSKGIVHWSDCFEFALATGLRVQELLSANAGEIKAEDIGGRISHFLRVLGKGGKWRWVPVDDVWEIIERRRALMGDAPRLRQYLFQARNLDLAGAEERAGRGLLFFELAEPHSFSQILRRARIACRLPATIKPHALRHTFAVRFLEDDRGDIYTLSQILGHSSVSTTEIYLSATPRLLRMRGKI